MNKFNDGLVGFFWLFVMALILVLIFIVDPYCEKHHEEWEKERYEKFTEWFDNVGNDIHW